MVATSGTYLFYFLLLSAPPNSTTLEMDKKLSISSKVVYTLVFQSGVVFLFLLHNISSDLPLALAILMF